MRGKAKYSQTGNGIFIFLLVTIPSTAALCHWHGCVRKYHPASHFLFRTSPRVAKSRSTNCGTPILRQGAPRTTYVIYVTRTSRDNAANEYFHGEFLLPQFEARAVSLFGGKNRTDSMNRTRKMRDKKQCTVAAIRNYF